LADLGLGEKRRILVMNKVDLLPDEERARLARGGGDLPVVAISARDGGSTAPLLEAIEAVLTSQGFEDIAVDIDSASPPS
jgi:50S ribosomal subunit-associated GTPase HflX